MSTTSNAFSNAHRPKLIVELAPDALNATGDLAEHGTRFQSRGPLSFRRQSDLSIEPIDQFDDAFFFPDVSDAIAEDNQINRFEIERSDVDDLVDAIDLNQHEHLYDTNA